MKNYFTVIIYLVIAHFTTICYSQSDVSKSKIYSDSSYNFIEILTYGSTEKRTPFWIQSNQFGIVPRQGPAASFHAGIEQYWNISQKDQNVKAWRVGGGVEAAANVSNTTKFIMPQLFAAVRVKNWELFVGRKKQWIGLADSTLGMGSYIWSGNALPIPKIQIGTTKFVSVPLTGNWLAVNAFYSEGLFEKNRPVTSELKLHQKALYLRLGKANSRVRLYGGFNHQVQWGGKSPYFTLNGQMPGGLKSYFYVITGSPHAAFQGLTHFDSTNRIGNHLGTIDLAIEIDMHNASLFFYRQNIYEDGSLYRLNNIDDGLNGIRFRRKSTSNSAFQITEAVLEFLYTKSQGGSVANADATVRGKDNYFNNPQVRDGWSYYDRTIGTPFITPTSDTKWNYPNYSDFYSSNNRLLVWNVGLRGNFLERISWTVKFSYSENYGTYDVPFETAPKQYSSLLSFEAPLYFLGGTILKGSAAADIGKLYPKTYGFSLGIRKDGIFNINEKKFGNYRN